MVGISTNWENRKQKYNSDLKIKNIKLKCTTLHLAYKIEQRFLRKYDHLRPTESLGFGGWTECIRIEE